MAGPAIPLVHVWPASASPKYLLTTVIGPTGCQTAYAYATFLLAGSTSDWLMKQISGPTVLRPIIRSPRSHGRKTPHRRGPSTIQTPRHTSSRGSPPSSVPPVRKWAMPGLRRLPRRRFQRSRPLPVLCATIGRIGRRAVAALEQRTGRRLGPLGENDRAADIR